MVDRYPENDEYYENADDLLQEDDIIEADVRIIGWKKKFRIRALTFEQMGRINKKSLVTDKDTQKTEVDDTLFAYWTVVEGVMRPKFTFIKAQGLGEKNGEFVKELADEIWSIGRVSKTVWDSYISSIKQANDLATKK